MLSTPITAAAVALLGWAALYTLGCWIWPFKRCRRCEGSGKRRSPSGRAWRTCPHCRGGGGRLRAGRHLWNYFSRTRRDAS
jgi:hypothetical protein